MAESKARNNKKNPCAASKVCEFMTFSGKEAFKRLRTNTLIALADKGEKKCKVIGITSAQPSEGKSTISINLAYSIAELGNSVLLVDGDMRRPTVNKVIGVSHTPGLSEVLEGTESLTNLLVHYESSTSNTSFSVIPSGELPNNPSELINSDRFKRLIEAATNTFDYVIIDLPPVGAVIDAVNAAKYVDGMIVVLREGHCPRHVLIDCVEQLRYAKCNILGFVMNGCIAGTSKRYQYKSAQPYYGKY